MRRVDVVIARNNQYKASGQIDHGPQVVTEHVAGYRRTGGKHLGVASHDEVGAESDLNRAVVDSPAKRPAEGIVLLVLAHGAMVALALLIASYAVAM